MAGDIRGKKPHTLPPLKASTSPRGGPPMGDSSPLAARRPPADLTPIDTRPPEDLMGDSMNQALKSPGKLTRRHRVNLKSLSSPSKAVSVEEDFRTLSIGSPIPCGTHTGDAEEEEREGEVGLGGDPKGAFPAITVEKCEEQIINELADRPGPCKPLSASMEEPDLSSGGGGNSNPAPLPYRRSVSIQDSLSRESPPVSGSGSLLTPTPPVFRKHPSSRVLQYYSNHSSLPPSRSDGDILATIKHRDQPFDKHHPRFRIEVDRPPTPWKTPPTETPPVAAGALSPLSTPRRSGSPGHSPLSPRKPVRLVPLQYSRDSKCSPPETDHTKE